MNKFFYCAALVLLLGGCAAPIQGDRRLAGLMPESAAIRVLEKNIGVEWAAHPYVEKTGSCAGAFPKLAMTYSDIKGIVFNPTLGRLFVMKERPVVVGLLGLDSCLQRIAFPMDQSAASEVATALRSLGACTSPQSFSC